MSRIFHIVRGVQCVSRLADERTGDKHDGDKILMIIVKDESTGCVSAHVCEGKGAGDRQVVDSICDDIGFWGHTELITRASIGSSPGGD